MPKELKVLVVIITWILFIYGCLMLINTMLQNIFWGLSGELAMTGQSVAIVSFILAAVAAKLRQMLE